MQLISTASGSFDLRFARETVSAYYDRFEIEARGFLEKVSSMQQSEKAMAMCAENAAGKAFIVRMLCLRLFIS